MATILTKKSDTASAVPLAADLTNAAGGAELAVNATDKRLFSKTSGGSVVELGTNPSSLTMPNGTANGLAFLNASKVVTSGSALTFDGTNFGTTGNANLGSGSKSTDTQLNFLADTGTQRIYIERGSRSLVFYDVGAAIENYRIAGITGIQSWGVGGSEQMRLTSTGLGIGTSSPASKLTVSRGGSAGVVSNFTDGLAQGLALTTGTGYFGFYNPNYGAITFRDGGNTIENMRLTDSGNLGLGVTPSAWDSARAFQFGPYGGSLAGSTGQSGIYLNSNVYYGSGAWRYATTGTATQYKQNENTGYGGHSWLTAASGTAGNAITFTQAMTLDASGNLLVGTTTAVEKVTVNGRVQCQWNAYVNGGNTSYSGDASGLVTGSSAGMWAARSDSALLFSIGSTERARIDSSGNLLVGTTSQISSGKAVVSFNGVTFNGLVLSESANTSNTTYLAFNNGSTVIGSVSRVGTTSAVVYNTTSDYRLKSVTGDVTGQGARIDALKPVDYQWKEGGQQARGFLAHEFQTVYPNSVSGDKDAVDADGNPVYQAMQAATSEVIADLIAEIKSLRVRVAQLESN